jgi:hypothetical protein
MLLLDDFIFLEKELGVKLLVLAVHKIQRWCWWLFWKGGKKHDWAAS